MLSCQLENFPSPGHRICGVTRQGILTIKAVDIWLPTLNGEPFIRDSAPVEWSILKVEILIFQKNYSNPMANGAVF